MKSIVNLNNTKTIHCIKGSRHFCRKQSHYVYNFSTGLNMRERCVNTFSQFDVIFKTTAIRPRDIKYNPTDIKIHFRFCTREKVIHHYIFDKGR